MLVPNSLADPISAMEKSLKSCECIKSISIFTHGYNGGISVGSDNLYTEADASELARIIKPALCANSKIRLMSCGSKGGFPKALAQGIGHGVQYGTGQNGAMLHPKYDKDDSKMFEWTIGGSGTFYDVGSGGIESSMVKPLQIMKTGFLDPTNPERVRIEKLINDLVNLGLPALQVKP